MVHVCISDPPIWWKADTIRYRNLIVYIADTDTDTKIEIPIIDNSANTDIHY